MIQSIQNSQCTYCFGPFGYNPQAPFHRTKKCRNPNNKLSLVANAPGVNSQAVVLMGAKSGPMISSPGMGVVKVMGGNMGVMGGPMIGAPGMGVVKVMSGNMGNMGAMRNMGNMGGMGNMGSMGGNKKKSGNGMHVHVHHHHYNSSGNQIGGHSTGSNQANGSGIRNVSVAQGHISCTKPNPNIILLGSFP